MCREGGLAEAVCALEVKVQLRPEGYMVIEWREGGEEGMF